MNANFNAPQHQSAGMAYSALAESREVSEGAWNDAVATALQSLQPDDVLDELADYEDALRDAQSRADGAAIGWLYLAARQSLAERLAEQVLGIERKGERQ
jgi:hypothetical protein